MAYTNLTAATVLGIIFLSSGMFSSRVYSTSDSRTTEVGSYHSERDGRSFMNNVIKPPTVLPAAMKKNTLVKSFRFPASTFLINDNNDCWTSDGKNGICSPSRSCYLNKRLQEPNDIKFNRFQPSRNGCRYFNSFGQQVSGVCCPRQSFINFGGVGILPYFPFGPSYPWIFYPFPSPVSVPNIPVAPPTANWPWWVPQSPPVLPPTESPWWIPESTTTTAAPPTTTTPVTTTTENPQPPAIAELPSPTTIPDVSTPGSPSVESVLSSNFSCGAGPYKALKLEDQQRIVGGTTATKNSWPFTVSLIGKGRHFCGGSLLDSIHVLTAAHCVAQLSPYEIAGLDVILGMHTLKPMDPQVVRRKIRRVTRHRNYDAAKFHNDIAILTMDLPVEFSNIISPVCLPSIGTKDSFVNEEAVVVGWGALKEDGKLLPTSLQQVTVQVQDNDACKKSYGDDAPGGIVDYMLCAAYPNRDSCMGDSGGPLVTQATPGAPWIQVGIVSWGIGCGRENFPGVYIRTTSFLDWIHKNLN